MEKNLFKIQMIKEHNHAVKLEKNNKRKIKEIKVKCKDIITEYQKNNNKIIKDMEENIIKINKENEQLNMQLAFYKSVIDRIPKFILKIFIKKYKSLNQENNNGKREEKV